MDEVMEQRARLLLPLAIVLFLMALRFDLVVAVRAAAVAVLAASFAGARSFQSAACFAALRRTLVLARAARICAAATQTPFEFAAGVSAETRAGRARIHADYTQARFGGAPCDTIRLRALLEQIRSSCGSALKFPLRD